MKIKIELDLENDSFKMFPLMEIDTIMKQAQRKIFKSMDGADFKEFDGILLDTNGNTVGTISVVED